MVRFIYVDDKVGILILFTSVYIIKFRKDVRIDYIINYKVSHSPAPKV